VTKDAWNKLEVTVDRLGIFVGYTDTPRMTVVHRDVKFDEVKAMQFSLERELQLHVVDEPHIDVEQPHVEDLGVETSTQAKSSRYRRKRTREVDRLLYDAQENVGEPTYQHRQRRSLERYNGYMALMSGFVETYPSSLKEEMQQIILVDAMVEEYDSKFCNSVWDVVPRLEDKSVVRS